ncbi:hypothetical protein P43SY_006772 [Pythium insidiosum]|uniref:FYVE-type domain-containing protein n=1 Tax=Pythium insidiosum TaxID=114742 RepID=A0AAD5QAL1_PYTIN|nr:hypothetical protein P43SY_006772 [Pythium insidiosum]
MSSVSSYPRSTIAGLCAMVSWCFHAPPSNEPALQSTARSAYMTRQETEGRRKAPWFLGGDVDTNTSTSSSDDDRVLDRTMIKPANHPPPQWLRDDHITACMQCDQPFNVVTRKHHCRGCGLVFCVACTSQTERVLKYGFPDPVRVCADCAAIARVENEFYERHLPLLERGAAFIKHGLLVKRTVLLKFDRSRLLFQYQTIDSDTGLPTDEIKAFPLDGIDYVREVVLDKDPTAVGMLVVVGTDEHRFDAASTRDRARWIAAIESVRAIRHALLSRERDARSKQIEEEHAEIRQAADSLKQIEERKASFHQERLRKRAERRESLRAKYNLGTHAATTAAS